MCVQDLRIGRSTECRGVNVQALGSSNPGIPAPSMALAIAGGDPSRISVAIAQRQMSYDTNVAGVTTINAIGVYTPIAGVWVPVVTLGPGRGWDIATIDQVGDAIRGELYAVNWTSSAAYLDVLLVRLLVSTEDIERSRI